MFQESAPVKYTGPGKIYCVDTLRPVAFERIISTSRGDVFLFDEENFYLRDREFLRTLLSSPNYFIAISREGLANLPYGIDCIYKMVGGPNHYKTEREYPHLPSPKNIPASIILCEDEGVGYKCTKQIFAEHGYTVTTSQEKNKLGAKISVFDPLTPIIVAADICGLSRASYGLMALTLKYHKLSFIAARSLSGAL